MPQLPTDLEHSRHGDLMEDADLKSLLPVVEQRPAQQAAEPRRPEAAAGIGADVRRLAPTKIDAVAAVLGLARLHQGDGFYLVAWQADEPLGHLHLALTDPPEVQDMYVRAEYRRQGVAAALTRHAEEEARARGFDRVRLTVSVDNAGAQAF